MLFIYIHGFNSSPESFKARCFSKFLQENYPNDDFLSPKLSVLPSKVINTLSECIELYRKRNRNTNKIALIGSSLGGFYATWLSQLYGFRAVLVNPAVNPQELLVNYLGKNKNYHTGEEYELTSEHILQLDKITTHHLSKPQNLMVLLQKGDEVLDYRLAEEKYTETHLKIEANGDHSFQDFEQHCENIYQFLV